MAALFLNSAKNKKIVRIIAEGWGFYLLRQDELHLFHGKRMVKKFRLEN